MDIKLRDVLNHNPELWRRMKRHPRKDLYNRILDSMATELAKFKDVEYLRYIKNNFSEERFNRLMNSERNKEEIDHLFAKVSTNMTDLDESTKVFFNGAYAFNRALLDKFIFPDKDFVKKTGPITVYVSAAEKKQRKKAARKNKKMAEKKKVEEERAKVESVTKFVKEAAAAQLEKATGNAEKPIVQENQEAIPQHEQAGAEYGQCQVHVGSEEVKTLTESGITIEDVDALLFFVDKATFTVSLED